MDGRNLELNRAAQKVIGQRQRGPEHRGLPNLDRVLGKAIEHVGVQSHARLFGQAYDLVSFLAALVLKLYQLKGRAHARQNCGTRLDAGQRLLAGVSHEIESLFGFAQLVRQVEEING